MGVPLPILFNAATHVAAALVQGRNFTAGNHEEISETAVAIVAGIAKQLEDAVVPDDDDDEDDHRVQLSSPFYDMLIDRVTERVLEKMHMKEPR